MSDFGSGHHLVVHEFEPCVSLCVDNSEPGGCFRFCVSLSLCSSPTQARSLSHSKINKKALQNCVISTAKHSLHNTNRIRTKLTSCVSSAHIMGLKKPEIVNILVFVGHVVSVANIQHRCDKMKSSCTVGQRKGSTVF